MIDDAEMACCGREVGCWVPDLKSFALVSIEDVESYTPDPSLLEKMCAFHFS